MKTLERTSSASAIELLNNLASQTKSFRIEKVESFARASRQTWDYRVHITPGSGPPALDLNVVMKARLNPQIAWEVLNRARAESPHGIPTICCPAISPRVAEMCREAGVSYYDANGNAHLEAPGFLLHVTGQAHRRKVAPADNGADPFAPKSSRIARVLLSHPERQWQVQTLAREAMVAMGLASRVKNALTYQGFLEKVQGGIRVKRPRELLEQWARHYRPPTKAIPLYVMGSPPEVENRIAHWCEDQGVQYGLTQFSGAWRVAPMVRYQRSTVFLDLDPAVSQLDALIGALQAKRVETGANVTLWPTTDPAVFFGVRQVDAVQVVSPVQLYLDLYSEPGRGQEAASEVLQKEIAPVFSGTQEGQHV